MSVLAAALVAAVLVPGLTVASPAGAGGSLPAPVPFPGGKVAYAWETYTSTSAGPPWGIAAVGINGSGDMRLTDGTQDELLSDWSPDGKWVLYWVDASGRMGEMYLVSASGGSPVDLGPGTYPKWSPDGTRIAYTVGGNYPQDIMVAPVTGNPPSLDTSHQVDISAPAYVAGFTWSPDGRSLSFLQGRDLTGDHFDLWIVAADGSNRHQVTNGLNITFIPQAPTWSPLGNMLAFMTATDNPDGTFSPTTPHTVATDGSLLSPLPSGEWDWHPSGLGLVISNGGSQLTVVSPTGQTIAQVPVPGSQGASSARWTPDGTSITYIGYPLGPWSSTNRWQIFVLGADGTGNRVIASGDIREPDEYLIYSPGTTLRTFGLDSLENAVALAQNTFTGAASAVLATTNDYADGLAGTPLAGSVDGPLLLNPPDQLAPSVGTELQHLGVHTVYLLGGDTALGPGVEAGLSAIGITDIRRIAGADRYATAAAVATQLGGSTSAFLAEGADADPSRGWPDAVAAGGLAAHLHQPILLTQSGSLPAATQQALSAQHITNITILGGTAVVSDSVASQLEAMGITVTRVAGADRYATSAAIATASTQLGLSTTAAVIATGLSWKDSLPAGPAAAHLDEPLLLVDGADLAGSAASQNWIHDHAGQFTALQSLGGPSVITPGTLTAINQVADGG